MAVYYNKEAKGYRLKKTYQPKSYQFRKDLLRKISQSAVTPTRTVPGVSPF